MFNVQSYHQVTGQADIKRKIYLTLCVCCYSNKKRSFGLEVLDRNLTWVVLVI